MALAGEADKDVFVGVFRRGDELVGMWSWEQVPDTLSLYGRLIIVAPAHREAKLASKVMPLAEFAGRAMGAEFLFGLATLKIPHMQRALESAGYQLIGFTSGYDREEVAPGVVKRVFEAVFTKVLVPEAELVRPDPNNLTMGAQFQYSLATLTTSHVQRALEHAGYRLLGFFPGYGREEVAPGVVKRVYEAVYAKLLVSEDEVHRPDPKNMTPKTRALFDLLFPE